MAVTMNDVAREAGVSLATASRALAGTRRVNPELVARVQEAARRIGYRHNAVAKALREQKSGTVGMLVPEISNPFFPAIVEAVERQLQSRERELILCDSQGSTAIERRRIQALLGRQVDGLLVIPVDATESAAALTQAAISVAVVQIDRFVDGMSLDWVGVDDAAGMHQVVDHLLGQGAASIAVVSAEPSSSTGRQRLDALRGALDRNALKPAAELLGEFSIGWGKQAATELLKAQALPDAVVCGNDEIALGLLHALADHGVQPPRDLLVTGFDDIAFASLLRPGLTTVRQPRESIATEAIRLLDSRVSAPTTAARRLALNPELVIRDSTMRK
jgi:LacI family transcriptional regulator